MSGPLDILSELGERNAVYILMTTSATHEGGDLPTGTLHTHTMPRTAKCKSLKPVST